MLWQHKLRFIRSAGGSDDLSGFGRIAERDSAPLPVAMQRVERGDLGVGVGEQKAGEAAGGEVGWAHFARVQECDDPLTLSPPHRGVGVNLQRFSLVAEGAHETGRK